MPFQKLKRWGVLLLIAVSITYMYLLLQYQPGPMLTLTGLAGSIMLGSLYLMVEEKVFGEAGRRRPMLNVAIMQTLVCGMLVFFGLLFLYLLGGISLLEAAGSNDPADLQYTEWMFQERFWLIFFWSLVSGGILSLLRIGQEAAGPNALSHLLSGRFAKPRQEERILLRIGLRNADGLRSSLGNERFFLLSNDLFHIITPVAQKLKAEVKDQGEGYLELTFHPRQLSKAADPSSWKQLEKWSAGLGVDYALNTPSPYVYLSREQLTIGQVEGLRRQLIYLHTDKLRPGRQIPPMGLLFCQSKLSGELPSVWEGVEE